MKAWTVTITDMPKPPKPWQFYRKALLKALFHFVTGLEGYLCSSFDRSHKWVNYFSDENSAKRAMNNMNAAKIPTEGEVKAVEIPAHIEKVLKEKERWRDG